MVHSYEDWGALGRKTQLEVPRLLEAYSGTAIVQWHGTIGRQIEDKITDAETNRNAPYANRLRAFLNVWRDNEITGSINREQVDVLSAACKMLSVDPWNLSNYFSNLYDQLRKLVAAAEELPQLGADDAGPGAMGGGPGGPPVGGPGGPPSEFGAEEGTPEMGPDGKPLPPKQGETGGPADDFDIDSAVKNTLKSKTKQAA